MDRTMESLFEGSDDGRIMELRSQGMRGNSIVWEQIKYSHCHNHIEYGAERHAEMYGCRLPHYFLVLDPAVQMHSGALCFPRAASPRGPRVTKSLETIRFQSTKFTSQKCHNYIFWKRVFPREEYHIFARKLILREPRQILFFPP